MASLTAGKSSAVSDGHSKELDNVTLATDESQTKTDSIVGQVTSSNDGNGRVVKIVVDKTVKPLKTVVQGPNLSSAVKCDDHEVFIPAPLPTTNAWTKRMQSSSLLPDTKHLVSDTKSAGKDTATVALSDVKNPVKDALSSTENIIPLSKTSPHSLTAINSSVQLVDTCVIQPVDKIGHHLDSHSEVAKMETDLKNSRLAECDATVTSSSDSGQQKHSGAVRDPLLTVTEDGQQKHSGAVTDPLLTEDVALTVKESQQEASLLVSSLSQQSKVQTRFDEPWHWENSNQKSMVIEDAHLSDSADWPSLNKAATKEDNIAIADITVEHSAGDSLPSDVIVENSVKSSSDSIAVDYSSKCADAASSTQQTKKKGKGNKQKWLPYDLDLHKPSKRHGSGRTRGTDSRDHQDSTREVKEGILDGGHDAKDHGRRLRDGRGGREACERGARRSRREPGDKVQQRLSETEVVGSSTTEVQSEQLQETRCGWHNSGPSNGPTRMGYQGTRRATNRGRGYIQRGARFQPPLWNTAAYSYVSFGVDPSHYYCPVEPSSYFTPLVSQSDYYTSVLADDAAKKLIAQQIEYYFSTENLNKDFFLRRQMDADGWIPVDLLASFRRVRIHTGSVNVQLIVESMINSKIVEISADEKHMRTRQNPTKWSLKGVEPTTFSSLNASVPEFVPGQPFKLQTAEEPLDKMSDGKPCDAKLKSLNDIETASDVSGCTGLSNDNGQTDSAVAGLNPVMVNEAGMADDASEGHEE